MARVPEPSESTREQQAKRELVARLLGPELVGELELLMEGLRRFGHVARSRGVLLHWSVITEPAPPSRKSAGH